jgi:hypothetical protein
VTSYIVLCQSSGDPDIERELGNWTVAGPPVEAVSAEAAIRKAVDGDKGGTYVAVPIRSWAPVTVTVETKRTLKLV